MSGDSAVPGQDRTGEIPVVDPHLAVGAYAVDALEGEEHAVFEAHLAQCAECRDELDSLRSAAASLGSGLAARPSSDMRAAVLSRIRDVPQVSADSPEPESTSLPLEPTAAPPLAPVIALHRKRFPAWIAGIAAAVLAVVAIGVGIRSLDVQRQLDDSRAMAGEVTRLLTAPDVEVSHGQASTGGDGTLVTSAAQDGAMFLASGLPTAPEGHTYQLWTLAPGQAPTSAGVFKVSSGGAAAVQVPHTSGVAVTVEPAGGSAQPTTDPVLALTVA